MEPREVLIRDTYAVADSGTLTENIDVTDPITAMYVQVQATNGATSNVASPLAHCVSKIEIVDGGTVLYSMPGVLLRGVEAHLGMVTPHSKISEIGGDSQYDNLPVCFGRFKYDPVYAFNPNAFLNPQIKVTWNLAAVNAVGATGFVTSSTRITIQLHLMQKGALPQAMLVNKEYESFTSAASGDYISELPVDMPIRALFVRGYESGVALNSSLTRLKYTFDNGKYIPFDMSIPKFWRSMVKDFGVINSEVLAQVDNGSAFQNWLAFVIGANVNGRSSGVIATADNHDNSQSTVNVVSHAGTGQTGAGVWFRGRGTSLENTVVYPFGIPSEPETWLDPTPYRNSKLYISQGNAGASVSVGLQQVYKY